MNNVLAIIAVQVFLNGGFIAESLSLSLMIVCLYQRD